MKIVILGGSGYAGSAIVAESANRGFETVSISRKLPENQVKGVNYLAGSLLDDEFRRQALEGADVVVATLSPRGDMAGKLGGLYQKLAQESSAISARFFVIGGFGSMKPSADAARFAEGEGFPDDYKPEALELMGVLDYLSGQSNQELDWLYVSPAQEFGGFNPGQRTGKYRLGGEVAFFDVDGKSQLSALDLAIAIMDEAEKPEHHREHISVAY